jgi:hypothetical protein
MLQTNSAAMYRPLAHLYQNQIDVARWQSSPEGTTSPFLVPEPSPLSEAINAHNGDS